MKQAKPDDCLIILNGDISARLLKKFCSNSTGRRFYTLAADGAANAFYKHKLIPDCIIGDLDSALPPTLAYFKKRGTKIQKVVNQNQNDFEKALRYAIAKGFGKFVVLGATGKRLDHAVNNLSILKKFHRKAEIRLVDRDFEYFMVSKSTSLKIKKGGIVSLLPFPKAERVKTVGLQYLLNRETLELGKRSGALNKSTGGVVSIEIGKGVLLVCREVDFNRINPGKE